MDPKKVYEDNLPTIRKIAASVARKGHLNPQEAEDFVQDVCVRLYESDCAIIAKFQEKARLSTYLTTVIARLLSERRVSEWGKWRPSAEAKRIGDKAVTLERLMYRDGYSFAEAAKILTTPAGAQFTVEELELIYLRLPHRNVRPMEISSDVLPDAVAVEPEALDRVERSDRERTLRRAAKTIDDILLTFPAQDRLMLQLRFWSAKKAPDIALTLHIDQKKIYKRLDQIFEKLRHGLERAGVSKDVARLLVHGDQELKLELVTSAEIADARPSPKTRGEGARGGRKEPK